MTDELRVIVAELDAAIRNDGTLLLSANDRERTLTMIDFSEEVHDEIRMRGSFPYSGVTGRAVERRTPMIFNDAHLDPRALVFSDPVVPEGVLVYPLLREGVVVGCINLYRDGAGIRFDPQELEDVAPFADRLAAII